MKFKKQILFIATVGITIIACSKKDEAVMPIATNDYGPKLPEEPYSYSYNAQFFGGNSNLNLSDENITLGRVLFYEKALSFNNQISCGSCHFQDKGFADNVKFHKGVTGNSLKRNTLSITGNNFLMFWDGRANSMKDLVLRPIANHEEMMQDPKALVNKIKQIPYYKSLFEKVYGDDEINLERIEDALASFSVCIVPSRTKFDGGLAQFNGFIDFSALNNINYNLSGLTSTENQGFKLFYGKARCGSCHHPEIIAGYYGGEPYANIGLDMDYSDNGLGTLTNDASENGKFKIPNIRNVALTAPYMHDGRFSTLEEVVDHYNSKIKPNTNLSTKLYQDVNSNSTVVTAVRLGLNNEEKAALVAFLKTLTDEELKKDIKFSNPF